jgi:uncharacterized membrane protein
MDKVGFLVWYSDLAIGAENNSLVSDFLNRACKLIEQEINQEGGFAGLKVEIVFSRVPKGVEGIEQIRRNLDASPEIALTHGHPVAANTVLLLESLDLNKIAVLNSAQFKLVRASKEGKIKAVNHWLQQQPEASRTLLLHDGKRFPSSESDLALILRSGLTSINFQDSQEPSEIEAKLTPIFEEITDDHRLIVNVGLKVFKPLYDYLNESGKQPKVISLFGSLEGRFEQIGFPLTQVTAEYTFPTLAFEDLVRRVGIPLTEREKALVQDSSWRLEMPLLAAHASQYMEKNISDKKALVEGLSKAIGEVDGVRDIFVGKRLMYAFENQENILKDTYCYQFPTSLQTKGSYPKLLCPEQVSPNKNAVSAVVVNYTYIDILRITNLDIGEGTWTSEFYLDVVSRHKDPIDILSFNNLSSLKPKFEVKLLWAKYNIDKEETSYRYYCVGNFDFVPDPDNYPFDWQYVFLSLSIIDEEQYGILQPVPEALLDREFKINGWSIQDGVTGIRRRKATVYEGSDLTTRVQINDESRVGWILSRTNTFAIVKIGIPLFFLLFLVYYTLFRPFADGGGSIGILTTAFLSGIALYFSTERPEPRRITTIDVIFLWYYVITGLCIVAIVGSLGLGEGIYIWVTYLLRFAVPLGLVGIGVYLNIRIRSNPSRISIDQDV